MPRKEEREREVASWLQQTGWPTGWLAGSTNLLTVHLTILELKNVSIWVSELHRIRLFTGLEVLERTKCSVRLSEEKKTSFHYSGLR